jgi:carbonic anhydrase/acetyltransferase-like protein (isoleucine patch superfamily)
VNPLSYKGDRPRIADNAFIADGCQIIGDVDIAPRVGVWFNCVLRGDEQKITVGENTNIQDGTVVHVHSLKQGSYIGANVTIGHMSLIHACTLEDWAFVGMGSIVLDEAVIESHAMLADADLDSFSQTIINYADRAQEYLRARRAQ